MRFLNSKKCSKKCRPIMPRLLGELFRQTTTDVLLNVPACTDIESGLYKEHYHPRAHHTDINVPGIVHVPSITWHDALASGVGGCCKAIDHCVPPSPLGTSQLKRLTPLVRLIIVGVIKNVHNDPHSQQQQQQCHTVHVTNPAPKHLRNKYTWSNRPKSLRMHGNRNCLT